MMYKYLQILMCLQREKKVCFRQIQGKCLMAAMYRCWFWVIWPIHYFPGYWRFTLTVEHWSSSNHFHSCHTSRSSSESMPTLLLCSLPMISLYLFFSDLILSQHCIPEQSLSWCYCMSKIVWNTASLLYEPDSCAWITFPDQIFNTAFISASRHVAPLLAMFNPDSTQGWEQVSTRLYIQGWLVHVKGINWVKSRFDLDLTCIFGPCERGLKVNSA